MRDHVHFSEQIAMPSTRPYPQAREIVEEDFCRVYRFDMQEGLGKSVTVSRAGQQLAVRITYIDGAVVDETSETFEADGAVRITLTQTGLYLAGHRHLLAGRVRLKRTRFF